MRSALIRRTCGKRCLEAWKPLRRLRGPDRRTADLARGPIGLGWSRWRACEAHYTRHNVDLLLQGLVEAGALPGDTPGEAMAQLLTGIITHAGVALVEAATRKRSRTRDELRRALHQVLRGL
jgi:hypothetical protein